MGTKYIEGPDTGKADFLIAEHGARELPACPPWGTWPQDRALVIVASNTGHELMLDGVPLSGRPAFDVAAWARTAYDYRRFTQENDPRDKRYLLMPRDLVEELTGSYES